MQNSPRKINGLEGSRVQVQLLNKNSWLMILNWDNGTREWQEICWSQVPIGLAQKLQLCASEGWCVTKATFGMNGEWYIQHQNESGSQAEKAQWGDDWWADDLRKYSAKSRFSENSIGVSTISFGTQSPIAILDSGHCLHYDIHESLECALARVCIEPCSIKFVNVCLSMAQKYGFFITTKEAGLVEWGGLGEEISERLGKRTADAAVHICESTNGIWLILRERSFEGNGCPEALSEKLTRFYSVQHAHRMKREKEISKFLFHDRRKKAADLRRRQQFVATFDTYRRMQLRDEEPCQESIEPAEEVETSDETKKIQRLHMEMDQGSIEPAEEVETPDEKQQIRRLQMDMDQLLTREGAKKERIEFELEYEAKHRQHCPTRDEIRAESMEYLSQAKLFASNHEYSEIANDTTNCSIRFLSTSHKEFPPAESDPLDDSDVSINALIDVYYWTKTVVTYTSHQNTRLYQTIHRKVQTDHLKRLFENPRILAHRHSQISRNSERVVKDNMSARQFHTLLSSSLISEHEALQSYLCSTVSENSLACEVEELLDYGHLLTLLPHALDTSSSRVDLVRDTTGEVKIFTLVLDSESKMGVAFMRDRFHEQAQCIYAFASPTSPAKVAGMRTGDVILAMKVPVVCPSHFDLCIQIGTSSGHPFRLGVVRDGCRFQVTLPTAVIPLQAIAMDESRRVVLSDSGDERMVSGLSQVKSGDVIVDATLPIITKKNYISLLSPLSPFTSIEIIALRYPVLDWLTNWHEVGS